ncbi:hypothetical protein BTO30_08740 [Domibacillus antri]|uniref:Uncharacterized protein n=1 Tax=Domibacillus antri TaxID=1714264 RepID=A0A1Q8Q5E5_9BACI|nr:hypothetical protein [Domibacillus antri]OLN22566.1 hypothetical protein BTO30_08740 [Domibacillus antri]
MGRTIQFEEKELVIKFSRLTAAAGLKKELRIPYQTIRNVEAGNFKLHWAALRLGGTSIPFGYKAGRFIYKGKKYFLSYSDASHVVVLDLQGHDFDHIVVQAGTPKQMKRAILKRCPHLIPETDFPS